MRKTCEKIVLIKSPPSPLLLLDNQEISRPPVCLSGIQENSYIKHKSKLQIVLTHLTKIHLHKLNVMNVLR